MTWTLPDFPNFTNEYRNGRNIYEGYQRGWGLQFADLRDSILSDPLYQHACEVAAGRTVVQEHNRMNLFMLIRFFLGKLDSQNIVEFGTYKGGNALFMGVCLKELFPQAQVVALDTFAGMPPTDPTLDLHGEGDFSDVDLDELRQFANANQLDNVSFVKGLFEDTFADVATQIGSMGLAHIDCDIYSGVAYAQQAVLPTLASRGYIAYDDACVSSCIGATQAVEEFIIKHNQHSEQIWPHFVFRKPD